jgi:hypothetical protein
VDHNAADIPVVDYLSTSVRTPWAELPAPVRRAVAQLCGAEVISADPPVTSGFSGGSASVLQLSDGRRVFAKAGYGANDHLLRAYRREAEVLRNLPATVPAPALVGQGHLPAGVAGEFAWQLVVTVALPGQIPTLWTESARWPPSTRPAWRWLRR